MLLAALIFMGGGTSLLTVENKAFAESSPAEEDARMATKGMTVFTQNGEDFIINDPNIANEFSTGTAYAVGDHVTYQGKLYVFTAAHSAGAWNAAHVVQKIIGEELNENEAAIAEEAATREAAITDLNSTVSQISEISEKNLINQADLLSIPGATYSNGWYSYNANQASIMYGFGSDKPSFPHGPLKNNTQYTLSFVGKYDESVSSGFQIGFVYTDGTNSRITTGDGSEKQYNLTSSFGKTISRIALSFNNNVQAYVKNLMLEEGTEQSSEFIPYQLTAIDKIARDTANAFKDEQDFINRFDKTKAIGNTYVAPGGIITPTQYNYSASDFIYIGDTETISYCNTFRLSLYKADKTWDSDPAAQNTVGFVQTIDRPATAEYMVISYVTENEDIVQVGTDISVARYYPYGKYRMTDLVVDSESSPSDAVVYVSKTGRGNFTSLLEALAETENDIEVVDGTFDIVAEYKAKYGNDFFAPGTDRSAAGDFALGLFITNRSVKFDANTFLSFDLNDNPASYEEGAEDRRFCLFNLGVNVVLDGAIGTTNGNWYAIHDDGAGGDYAQNYKNVIKNCVLICQDMVNKNVIGGGFGRYSETYVEDCYFDNGESGNTSYTIRYHNTWNGQAQPVCHIKNVYVNSLIYFGYYGGSTKIGTCTVNNCSMAGAIVLLPVTEASVENLRVLEWANVIRN